MKKLKAKSLLVLMIFALVATLLAACGTTATVDLKLAELKAGDVTLVETDGTYVGSVDYEVEKITISATANASAATVEGTGEKTLNVGKNEFTVTVSASGKSADYTVEITRAAADLSLKEIKIGDDVLTAGADGVYKYEVANAVSSVNIAAAATKNYAVVEGAGEKTLAVGENTFTITVKAGDSTKSYTVKVVRAAVDLSLKEVKIGENVITAGADGVYKYTVANKVTEITISAMANNENATVEGDGVKQNLVTGDNTFRVEVSVGEESKTYTVIIVREKSAVNTISEIKVNGNVVNYDDSENAYLVTVNDKTVTLTVTLTSEVSSYAIDPAVGVLQEGENEFDITVTAENGATAVYTLVIKLVLPTYSVTYTGNIDGAVKSEGFTYKHGEAQALNIALAEKYTQSYAKIAVTYKVGDGEVKTAELDENYGFTVPAEEAIGNIVVTVSGIEVNVYTITYHKNGTTTTETVKYGENAVNAGITPNTETKEVFDGYVYSHDEKWVTEENGMIVASLDNVTEDMEVYFKDDVIVRSEVAYYDPTSGYHTVSSMNAYVAGDKDGNVVFRVLIKSLATDGQAEQEGKTSFVIYGTATWNAANELGVSVSESELNKWFTVKATAADKKVTVYKPDGSVAAEKAFEAYAADTISLAIHADAAVAAVNPTVPELCTVTYLSESGEELYREKVVKGTAPVYDYVKPDEDLGDGYTKSYYNIKWFDGDGNEADLNNVSSNITVKLGYDIYVIKNAVVTSEDTKLTAISKFVTLGKDGKVTFRVRINDTSWSGFNVIATGGYIGISGGVWASPAWYIVTIDTLTGEIIVTEENGAVKGLDTTYYNPVKTTLNDIKVKLSDGNFDLAAVNVNVVKMEFYDADKTTLLKTELVVKGNSYTYLSEEDDEGYIKSIDNWLPLNGSDNKVYAAKVEYMRNQSTVGSDVKLLATNKYASVDDEGKITFKIRIAATGWTGVNVLLDNGNYVGISGGLSTNGTDWLTVTIDVASGDIVITNANGNALGLDKNNYKGGAVSIENVATNVSGATYDISVTK